VLLSPDEGCTDLVHHLVHRLARAGTIIPRLMDVLTTNVEPERQKIFGPSIESNR